MDSNVDVNYRFEVFVSCIFAAAIFGIFGNGLSLSSMLYATKKENHGFGRGKWQRNTRFIFNLVLVDLCACLLILIALAYGYITFQDVKRQLNEGIPKNEIDFSFREPMCHFIIIGVQDLAQITGWGIAFISFWHALNRYR